ncbi:sulfite exporter TauE/SafE family protein [Mongoliitalea daihaiensis]|uniref:sulfite exporter TauE/SafE family protein n=1 Tax=Mongoliitalea daihaiensis TaxID=2782006 RepID=UPI001F1DEA25|nr:sulfite exporter TauE/SafE family protein [Mongoliitalea daihaiensis]UJP63769.1 sulfite exporter TauE/SafE family protein [Mongoliitalea daihaiensis]
MERLVLTIKDQPFWFLFFLASFMVLVSLSFHTFSDLLDFQTLDREMFFWFLLVGFIAQTIDGALGMAYGVSSNSILLGIGIPPAVASAWVHIAQVFTSLASGISHMKLGNVDWSLAKRLLIPGVLGAVIGAFFLSSIDGNQVKPYIAVYLMVMGGIIIRKVFRKPKKAFDKQAKSLPYLATVGGFVDSIGGGGWGPVVNSTLMGKGQVPRKAIGTGNFVEIFVSLASASTFFFFVHELSLAPILGLIIGGVIASPFAALICKKLNPKVLMFMVGMLVIGLSIRTFYLSIV